MGVIAIETTVGGMTVAVVLPEMLLCVAEIVTGVLVVATPVAKPLTVIERCALSLDAQVTVLVMFWVVPSLKCPVAVYCCWLARGI